MVEKILPNSSKLVENNPDHIVAITQKFWSYPDRFHVDPDLNWSHIDEHLYVPPYYVSEKVLENKTWADPEDFTKIKGRKFQSYESPILLNKDGKPLNPRGPTGIEGRGILGRWGANFAADPIVTRINDEGFLEMISIKRSDCGQWALPGGMVDKGERVTKTLQRELGEEASAYLNFEKASLIYQGYVDDPRNTDNAWMETDAYHLHLTKNEANSINLQANDDAADAKWMTCSKQEIDNLYASHSDLVKGAISIFEKHNNLIVLENGKVIIKSAA